MSSFIGVLFFITSLNHNFIDFGWLFNSEVENKYRKEQV